MAFLDNWIGGSAKRTAVFVGAGIAVLVVGLVAWAVLDSRVDERIRTGLPVQAEVVASGTVKTGRAGSSPRVNVRYSVGGRDIEATLMSMLAGSQYQIGDQLTIYVDRTDPTKAATSDGFASEDRLMLLPLFLTAGGSCVAGLATVMRLAFGYKRRRRKRHQGAAP